MLKIASLKCPNCLNNKDVHIKYQHVTRFNIYFCLSCLNGFTNPIPQNLSKYYHKNYWSSPGIIGKTKNVVFSSLQSRRKSWLKKYLKGGSILEIGAGEGNFINSLGSEYNVAGIEFPHAQIQNKHVLKVNFLKWQSKQKFDAVLFWESLEHVAKPQKYLEKSFSLLKNKGLVLIEIPRFDCWESTMFKNHWFHLDPPRHLAHATDAGLKIILKRAGFTIVKRKSVLAYEYIIWGFLESILDIFGIKSTDYFKKNKFPLFIILLFPLLCSALFVETIFFICDQSPIRLVIARKNG